MKTIIINYTVCQKIDGFLEVEDDFQFEGKTKHQVFKEIQKKFPKLKIEDGQLNIDSLNDMNQVFKLDSIAIYKLDSNVYTKYNRDIKVINF